MVVMKEKSKVMKTHTKSVNSSHQKTTVAEKHRHITSNSDREKIESEKYKNSKKNHNEKSTDKYKGSKESNKKKEYRNEGTHDESYEELSRKKRKIERELLALDLEEAAAKRQKLERKTSKHQNVRDKNESSSDEDRHSEKNRQKLERKTSKHRHVRVKDEPSSEQKKKFSSDRDRHKLERVPSKYQNVPVKAEPLSDEDRHSERNRQKQDRRAPRHPNVPIKKEPLNEGNNGLPSENTRPESSSRISKNNEFGSKSNPVKDKEKPDFAVSGKLAEDTNVFNGVVIKYNEPSEARKPKRRWRLYPFKGESDLPFIPIHRQSAYLLGRTRAIADIPIDHPSCSKQHAVLQFRLVPYTREDGTKGRRVRPYIIDLESANGTFVNNNRIDPRCYVELMEKDVIKFGYSSREYVLLHEESKNDDYDDVRDSN